MNPAPREIIPVNYSQQCGKRLRALREKAGLNQTELAEQLASHGLKVSYAAISRWERGENDPPLNALPPLASLFGLKEPRTVLAKLSEA